MSIAETSTPAEDPATRQRAIRAHEPEYGEIVEFLYEEAALLDHLEYQRWGDLLDEGLSYRAPLRQTRTMADNDKAQHHNMAHFADNYRTMMFRINRLINTKSAYAEDPPSRTRRLVTNIRAWNTAADEYTVISYLTITRNRFDEGNMTVLSGEREDVLRRGPQGLKLLKRSIVLDQSTLGVPNLAIFL